MQSNRRLRQSKSLDRSKKQLAKKARKGDRDAAIDLIRIYIGSYRLDERKKAVPILEGLVSGGDAEAIRIYSLTSFEGAFGRSTDQVALNHRDVLQDKFPTTWEEIDSGAGYYETAFRDFGRVKSLYDDGFPYCEQPGNNQPILSVADSPLRLKYLDTCLSKYSYLAHSRPRLSALSKIKELECELVRKEEDDGKLCLSVGYKLLATGQREAASQEDLLSAAHAASKIFNTHVLKLRPLVNTQLTQAASKHVYEQIQEAQQLVNEQEYDNALEVVTDLLQSTKNGSELSQYEMASVLNFQGFVYYQLGDFDNTIQTYKRLIAIGAGGDPNLLWQTHKTLLQLYALNKQPRNGIKHFVDLVVAAPTDIEFVPTETIVAAQELPND